MTMVWPGPAEEMARRSSATSEARCSAASVKQAQTTSIASARQPTLIRRSAEVARERLDPVIVMTSA